MGLILVHQAGMEDSLVLNSYSTLKVEFVGGSALASLATVHSIELVVLEEVELVVRVVLAVLAVLVEHVVLLMVLAVLVHICTLVPEVASAALLSGRACTWPVWEVIHLAQGEVVDVLQ